MLPGRDGDLSEKRTYGQNRNDRKGNSMEISQGNRLEEIVSRREKTISYFLKRVLYLRDCRSKNGSIK